MIILTETIGSPIPTTTRSQVGTVSSLNGCIRLWSSQKKPRWKGRATMFMISTGTATEMINKCRHFNFSVTHIDWRQRSQGISAWQHFPQQVSWVQYHGGGDGGFFFFYMQQLGGRFDPSRPTSTFFFSRDQFMHTNFHSWGQDQSTMAQQAGMSVEKHSPMSYTWASFPERFPLCAWTA